MSSEETVTLSVNGDLYRVTITRDPQIIDAGTYKEVDVYRGDDLDSDGCEVWEVAGLTSEEEAALQEELDGSADPQFGSEVTCQYCQKQFSFTDITAQVGAGIYWCGCKPAE